MKDDLKKNMTRGKGSSVTIAILMIERVRQQKWGQTGRDGWET